MFKIYWGVVLLLHPFILRLTSFGAQISGGHFSGNLDEWLKRAQLFEKLEVGRMGKDSFFLFAVMLSIFLFTGKGRLPKFERVCFSILLLFGFIGVYDFLSPNVLYQSIYFFTGVVFIKHFFENYKLSYRDFFIKILGISCLLQSGFVLLERAGIDLNQIYMSFHGVKNQTNITGTISGAIGNPNITGAYIALTAPLLRKSVIIPILALIALGSIMPIMTLIGVYIYFGVNSFINLRYIPFFGCSLMMLIFSIAGYSKTFTGLDSGRFWAWGELFKMDLNYIWGNGLGYFMDHFKPMGKTLFRSPHNEVLSLLVSHGLIGIGIVIGLLKKPLIAPNPLFPALLFGFFINSLGNFPFHVTTLFCLFGVYYVVSLKESLEVNYG